MFNIGKFNIVPQHNYHMINWRDQDNCFHQVRLDNLEDHIANMINTKNQDITEFTELLHSFIVDQPIVFIDKYPNFLDFIPASMYYQYPEEMNDEDRFNKQLESVLYGFNKWKLTSYLISDIEPYISYLLPKENT